MAEVAMRAREVRDQRIMDGEEGSGRRCSKRSAVIASYLG